MLSRSLLDGLKVKLLQIRVSESLGVPNVWPLLNVDPKPETPTAAGDQGRRGPLVQQPLRRRLEILKTLKP